MTNREYFEYHVKARQRQGNKYNAQKTLRIIDGKKTEFDSKHEAERWDELRLWEIAGRISDLQRQVKFQLLPAQRDKSGKTLERPVTYIADFAYHDSQGRYVVEDAKGTRTEAYKIKRKLMLYVHHIRVIEV